jgi:ferredoxin-NADP reductase
MPVPSFTITCTRKLLLARDVYEFSFTKPKGFDFKAGQFVLLDVPLLDQPEDIQTRAYSIASAPHEKELLFVVKLKPGGRASRWFEEAVNPGTEVRMQGPFGAFVLHPASRKDYLFIATGSGIAPFRSQVTHLLHRRHKRRIDLVFGVRTEQDLFWRSLFEELAASHAHFSFHLALSDPGDLWEGYRGRVQSLVPLVVPDASARSIYICGSPEMTKELKELCLTEWKVEKKDLHVEGYI